MKILLILGSIVIPIFMIILQRKWVKIQNLYNLVAIISALIFGNIASIGILNIINDGTVFMTNIHALFLNPFFLMTGGYLGVYLLYLIVLRALNDYK
ncbi:transposase [Bacillus salipaludis]|uniref:Transposase n=1 Tax=Bacillus salipaludis TaxID=2547811 RepID=A0A4R5VMH8_9BACI|nr:transposase [Bacillus salipaludis]TDK59387.1 transposase [Bacillus salipaludis]